MPKLDLSAIPSRVGSGYPGSLAALMDGRSVKFMGEAAGLTQFGVNMVYLEPGALSSLRHYHMKEDEFVIVTEGVCTLVDDTGEYPMSVGECAAFKAGDANGHHFRNDTTERAAFLVIGTDKPMETVFYSDVDMKVTNGPEAAVFTRRDGTPLPEDI